MTKYHINPETGRTGICKAASCPFGGDEIHSESREGARMAYEKFVAHDDDEATNNFATLKKSSGTVRQITDEEAAQNSQRKKASRKEVTEKFREEGEEWYQRNVNNPAAIPLDSQDRSAIRKAAANPALQAYLNEKGITYRRFLEDKSRIYDTSRLSSRISQAVYEVETRAQNKGAKPTAALKKVNKTCVSNLEKMPIPKATLGRRFNITEEGKAEARLAEVHTEFEKLRQEEIAAGNATPEKAALDRLRRHNPSEDWNAKHFAGINAFRAATAWPSVNGMGLKVMDKHYFAAINKLYPERNLPESVVG